MNMHLYTAEIWSKMYNNVKMYNIEVNAKCCHLKKFNCKGTLRQVFITVYGLEISNFLRIFSHLGILNPVLRSVLSAVAPLHFSLLPFSLLSKYSIYVRTVCGCEGKEVVSSCWRPFSAWVLHSVSDQIQNLQNFSTTPRPKPRRRGGLRQINTCRKVLSRSLF